MRFFALFLLIITGLATKAGDTLTRAQVYNFAAGDTFDYLEKHADIVKNPDIITSTTLTYSRCIISNVYYAQDSDTLYIVQNWVYPAPAYQTTLILIHPDSIELMLESANTDSACPNVHQYFNLEFLDDTTNENELQFGCDDGGGIEIFARGLGLVDSEWSTYNATTLEQQTVNLSLIYYAKGNKQWGTPYYIADQDSLVQYIPIPETCATWISQNQHEQYLEQIVTGNSIANGGHAYIEMLYSYYNLADGSRTTDSLAGYFRNDTAAQRVYFYSGLNDAPFQYYDFSVPAGGYITQLNQVEVIDGPRTYWYEACEPSSPAPAGYIAGIGGAAGLCQILPLQYDTSHDWSCSQLTCFSVCGQNVYVDSSLSISPCNFPTALNTVSNAEPFIKVFPTINTGQFNVQVSAAIQKASVFSIYDLTGGELKRFSLNKELNTFDISNFASGMYIWQALSDNKLLQTGKLIKE